ncbi:hypothetical protein PC116_g23421 [Phytophthora cactorum]|uniref:Uncharacterized protein n=1 Tax=Phytophthora cactorum TaxID=29920 RepID=A0A8T0ZPL8_9STRA|nr:hypothetical protein Pcac1_g15114 [Phytophthora cactorum]KAG2837401.1 hypothetical protein PC111_g4669 [Phytophthora cactorum]KAG2838242.1 hypothetical protein PC112_g4600 [Phytophthora cactorum]KAG2864240.1 hypothetical protein PC113_g4755 [Phytophthora cactorum]KAG2880716.1 hypothetical protein PC114_g21939 [Phytophthora cactorum]
MLFGTTYAADPLPLFSQVLRIARRKTLQLSIQPQGIVVADIGFSEESEALSFLYVVGTDVDVLGQQAATFVSLIAMFTC